MNFIVGLSMLEGYNAICVIINRLIKERYYVFYIVDDKGIFIKNITNIFIRYIFRLHELPALIIFDRGL